MSDLIEALEDFEDDLTCGNKSRHAQTVLNTIAHIKQLETKVKTAEGINRTAALEFSKLEAKCKELEKPRMPDELTAENGAKGLLIGEFKQRVAVCCPECGGDGESPHEEGDCEFCDGDGSCWQDVTIDWSTIKDIYKMAAKHFLKQD